MACSWICLVWVGFFSLNGCQAQRIPGAFVNLQIKSIQLLFFSRFCPGGVPLDIRAQHNCHPLCSAHQPWRLTLVKEFAGGRAPTSCCSCRLGCQAGGEAIQPAPFSLPPIPGCGSALAVYTELASGDPSWDQDPAVPGTDRSWRLSSPQRACAVSGEGVEYAAGKFHRSRFSDGARRPWETDLSRAVWEMWQRWASSLSVHVYRCSGPKCGWLLPTRQYKTFEVGWPSCPSAAAGGGHPGWVSEIVVGSGDQACPPPTAWAGPPSGPEPVHVTPVRTLTGPAELLRDALRAPGTMLGWDSSLSYS